MVHRQQQPGAGRLTVLDDERPPQCPACLRRLVILMTQSAIASGQIVRRQLWGCPIGHAVAERCDGKFGDVELLPDLTG